MIDCGLSPAWTAGPGVVPDSVGRKAVGPSPPRLPGKPLQWPTNGPINHTQIFNQELYSSIFLTYFKDSDSSYLCQIKVCKLQDILLLDHKLCFLK